MPLALRAARDHRWPPRFLPTREIVTAVEHVISVHRLDPALSGLGHVSGGRGWTLVALFLIQVVSVRLRYITRAKSPDPHGVQSPTIGSSGVNMM